MQRDHFKILHLIFLLNLPYSTFAQGIVEGYVVDATGKDTLTGATIFSGKNNIYTADAHGYYNLSLPEGMNTVECTLTGFSNFKKQSISFREVRQDLISNYLKI